MIAAVLVVASTNRGKVAELESLLGDLPLRLVPIDAALRDPPRVVEDGRTFAENAAKKARAAAAATGMLALADDSGLEVDALDGRPGVRSARFAREGAGDDENNAALIAELARSGRAGPFPARFRCVLAVADGRPGQRSPLLLTDGTCEGAIIDAPRGLHGFGYDPLFVVAGTGRTMAELTPAEKNRVSHRARAASALRPPLAALLTC